MEGWKNWEGKNIFLKTKSDRCYSGKVVEVDENDKLNGIIFLTIVDKFDKRVTFVTSEIVLIQEEN